MHRFTFTFVESTHYHIITLYLIKIIFYLCTLISPVLSKWHFSNLRWKPLNSKSNSIIMVPIYMN